MWTRSELKQRAKSGLKGYYWQAVLAVLLTGVVTWLVPMSLKLIPVVSIIAGPLAGLFLTNVLLVGLCGYFIKSARLQGDAGIKELASGFNGETYLNLVVLQFVCAVKLFLWSLLLVIPGIIKRYEYYMVPYLAAEYPEKDRKEIFMMSARMMKGNKLRTWVLELSFIGWFLLGALACGIGILFVMPYMQATLAELYLSLKEKRLGIGRGSQSAVKGYLVGVQGAFAGMSYQVEEGMVLTIGTDPTRCNIAVGGEQTSPVHLQIAYDGTWFYAADYSDAGTYIVQQNWLPKGQTVAVQPGSYLQLGTSPDMFVLMCQ